MLQVFSNDAGVWSLGFLTSFDRVVYLGANLEPLDIKSEVLTYSTSQYGLFGFEGFVNSENLLVSLGAVKMDNPCMDKYMAESGASFTWYKDAHPDGTIEVQGEQYDLVAA